MSDENNISEIDEQEAKKIIKKSRMRIKFQLYGFFKNLRFFEPFIYIIFINWGLSLFQIGILITIQEVITYLFEVPSGFIADSYGKKRELLLCFIFYIISFLFYFLGPSFTMLSLGAMFYGFGEAFRSGTHKAMEMQWLERHNLQKYKSYLYGLSRSWSLYGSALNSLAAIALIYFLRNIGDKFIFLYAMIPYALDFILISTYPSYMNDISEEIKNQKLWVKIKTQFRELKDFAKEKKFKRAILSSTLYDATFKGIKDYIQPIMKLFIAALIIQFSLNPEYSDFWIKMFLGIIYSIFYIISSISTRNAYNFIKLFKNDEKRAFDLLFDVFGITVFLIAIFIMGKIPIMVILLYMVMYMIFNMRRPILVGYIGEMAPKGKRTTILSIESQLKSIILFILAPIFGIIADNIGIDWLFIIIAAFLLSINILLKKPISDMENGTSPDESE